MGGEVHDWNARANGFGGPSPGLQPGGSRLLSAAGAATSLGVPIVGILYAVVRVGYDEYYDELGLTPESVGLGQAAIVSGVGVLMGLMVALVGTWMMFGVVTYRLVVPLRASRADTERSRSDWLGLVLAYVAAFGFAVSPALLARWVAGGAGLVLWASGAATAAVVAIQLSLVIGDSELRLGERVQRATRSA